MSLTYPLFFDPFTFEQYTLPALMGGFTLSDGGTVSKVEALALSYSLDVSDERLKEIGDLWERKFLETMMKAEEMVFCIITSRSFTPARNLGR